MIAISRKVTHDGTAYDLVAIKLHDTFDVYVAPADGRHPLVYMFGLPDVSPVEALDIGAANIPDYVPTMWEEEWS